MAMALQKTVSNESILKIVLVLFALQLVASSNIDCSGKAFHCVNSTHFMICVDLGGGVSSTIDSFIIPCPPSTVCQGTNHFECELTRSTTVLPLVEISVPSELRLSETTTVTETSIFSTTNEIIGEVQSTDVNLNTVSITTLQKDTVTTNKPVTESVLEENSSTTHYTNKAYTLTTAPGEFTIYTNTINTSTLTTSDLGYPVFDSSTPLYQDTVATLIINNVTVTTDVDISENIAANTLSYYSTAVTTNEIVPNQSATETLMGNDIRMGNDASSSFTTENYYEFATSIKELSVAQKKLLIADNTIISDQYQITTNKVIDTTVGTTTTKVDVDVTSTNMVITETFTEALTESNQLLNNVTSYSTPQSLTEVTNIENINASEVFVTTGTSQGSDIIRDVTPRKSVTEQYETLPDILKTDGASDIRNIYTNITAIDNAHKTELINIGNSTVQNNDGNNENITTIAGTTYDTTNTNAITQEHNSTESISQATMTNNYEGIEFTTTKPIEVTTSSVVTSETVNNLNQDISGFTLDGLTTTLGITTKSNISEDDTASILITGPVTISQFTKSESINDAQTTTSNIESSTTGVTSTDMSSLTTQTINNIDIAPSENKLTSNNLEAIKSSNVVDLTVSGVNITNTALTNFDYGKNTTEETSKKSDIIAESDNTHTQTTERNFNDHRFTEGILFDEITSTISSPLGSEITESANGTIVVENSLAFLNIKTENTITDTAQDVSQPNTTLLSVFDSTKDISNPLLVTESYKMSDTLSTFSDITNRLKMNTDIKVKDHFFITTVTDIPITIIPKIFTTELSQESTTNPTIDTQKGLDGTTEDSTYISTPGENVIDSYFIVKKITKKINKFNQGVTDFILGSKTGLTTNIIHDTVSTLEDKNFPINKFTTTESSLNSNNLYLVDNGTEHISQILTNADIINEKEFDMATSEQVSTLNPNIKITQTGTKEAPTTEISRLASELQTDSVKTNTQESILITEFSQSTVIESTPLEPILKPYSVGAKIKIETERTIDITAPNYTSYSPSVDEATNTLINTYDELATIKNSIPNEAFTDTLDSNMNSTPHQLSSENKTEFKATTVHTTQFNNKNEFSNTSHQITNYDLFKGNLSKSDKNANNNNKNISDSLQNLSIFTESTAARESVGKLNENINLKDTRNNNTSIGDVSFGVSNKRKDSLIASTLSTGINIVAETNINKNMKKLDSLQKTSMSGTEKTDKTVENFYDKMKSEKNLNLQLQLNNSFNTTEEENIENIVNKLTSITQPSIITNEQIIDDVNKTSTNSTNKDLQREIGSSPSKVVNDNNQNIYNINNYHLTDRIPDKLLKNNPIDFSQNNTPQQVSVPENEQYSLMTQENSAIKQSVVSDQKLSKIGENSTNDNTFNENVYSTVNVTSATNVDSLNYSTLLDKSLVEMREVSTSNASNKIVESAHEIKLSQSSALVTNLNQNTEASTIKKLNNISLISYINKVQDASTSDNVSLNHAIILDKNLGHKTKANKTSTTNVSFVESQVTSMPNDGSLKQTLALDQNQSQSALARETNTVNISSGTITINKTGVASIQEEPKASVIPNDGSLKFQWTSAGKLVPSTDSNLGGTGIKHKEKNNVMENTHLSLDSSLLAFPDDSVHDKVENVADKQKLFYDHSGNTAVHTTEGVTTTISTESTVKHSTQNSNRQQLKDPFCFARNRGRYADREDCTKFYVCIGRPEPIVGKCPKNTVFSEIKKQCTKNKSHCLRGNEFQCLTEGRFSDIIKNNAYYICVKRHNIFIRFKFQCQNGFYLNKITIRCTKQLETTNESSTSVDNENSNKEKSVSEGISSTETKKSKNNKDSKKKIKSEKFECKKEGKFADRDNCRFFFVCTKTKKSEFRMRRKSCDSDEVFHNDKKKCVDADSYEC